jgi:hypothetical protein
MERSNYLRAGLNVGAAYDDNPLLISSDPKSNTSVSIFPSFAIDESTSRLHWKLGYAGGLNINQSLTDQNSTAQAVNFDSQYRLSPHVNLRVAENFSYTTGFFDSAVGSGTVGSGGPNTNVLTPLASQLNSFTTVETNYHFALNDLVGASGSYYTLHYTDAPPDTALIDSQTTAASGFWLHRLFGKNWGGPSYRFQRITYSQGGETIVHSFLAVDAAEFSKHFTVAFYVGPQYVQNQVLFAGNTELSRTSNWEVSGGIEGGWADQHTSLTAGFARSISDGGGLLGAVRLQDVHGSFRREFRPGWAASVSGSYGSNKALIPASLASATTSNLSSVGASLEHNLGRSLGFRVGYSHDFQEQLFFAPNPTLDAHRNHFYVTLSYQWAKPLGM